MVSEAPTCSFLLWAHHSAPPTLTSLLILEQALHIPTSGPLHVLFPLPQVSTWLPLIVPSGLFSSVTISVRSSLNTLFKVVSFSLTLRHSHPPGLLPFLHSTYHDLMFCVFYSLVYYSQSSLHTFLPCSIPTRVLAPWGHGFLSVFFSALSTLPR